MNKKQAMNFLSRFKDDETMTSGLSKLKVKADLLPIARALNVIGRHSFSKSRLVLGIVVAYKDVKHIEEVQAHKLPQEKRSKDDFEKKAELGTIVAFRISARKAFSGKIVEIHKEHFRVETKDNTRYLVEKKDILWYKTGKRWPKGVFLMLKGVARNGHKKETIKRRTR